MNVNITFTISPLVIEILKWIIGAGLFVLFAWLLFKKEWFGQMVEDFLFGCLPWLVGIAIITVVFFAALKVLFTH